MADNDNADNIVTFPLITELGIPADRVLNAALKAGVQDVVICGYGSDGEEYFASNMGSEADILWLLERLKKQIMWDEEEGE